MNNEIYANGFFLVVLFNRIRTASVITIIAGIVSNAICVCLLMTNFLLRLLVPFEIH